MRESDFTLSVSLRTSTSGRFSLSYQRGFIGLAPHKATSDGEKPPPLRNWTKSVLGVDCINCPFPLCQTLDAVPSITGATLVGVALGDLHKHAEIS